MNFQIDREQSFIQNIMACARQNEIAARVIEKVSGVGLDNLSPLKLKKRPYPNIRIMTEGQADAAIEAAKIPADLIPEIKKLAGYPQKSADEYLIKFSQDNPQNPELEKLAQIGFGYAYRLMRTETKRDGKYLGLDACELLEFKVTRSTLSMIELGAEQSRITIAYKLVGQLGYRPDQEGFEKFCVDSAKSLADYLIRSEEFGRALFIHLYPDGETRKFKRPPERITQRDLGEATGISRGTVREYFAGEDVPKADMALAIAKLYGFSSEAEFYKRAGELCAANPEVIPRVKKPLELTKAFGAAVRTLREEIAISRETMSAHMPGETGKKYLTTIELGQRIVPISRDEQMEVAKFFGCADAEEFSQTARNVQALQNFRNQNFTQALVALSASGSDEAFQILDKFGAGQNLRKSYSVSPQLSREILQQLEMSEVQLYEAAKIPVPVEIHEAAQKVDLFIKQEKFKALPTAEMVGWTRSAHRGKLGNVKPGSDTGQESSARFEG